jgi:hypothetical protein
VNGKVSDFEKYDTILDTKAVHRIITVEPNPRMASTYSPLNKKTQQLLRFTEGPVGC